MLTIDLDFCLGQSGLYLIVESKTGIIYRVQCDGVRCLHCVQEGFLMHLGQDQVAKQLWDEVFSKKPLFNRGPHKWLEDDHKDVLGKLESIVSETKYYYWDENVEDKFLELDRDRLDVCVEAWIPVRSSFGKAILTFENSD